MWTCVRCILHVNCPPWMQFTIYYIYPVTSWESISVHIWMHAWCLHYHINGEIPNLLNHTERRNFKKNFKLRSLPPMILWVTVLTTNDKRLLNFWPWEMIHENTSSSDRGDMHNIDGWMEGWIDGCLDEMGRDGVGKWWTENRDGGMWV